MPPHQSQLLRVLLLPSNLVLLCVLQMTEQPDGQEAVVAGGSREELNICLSKMMYLRNNTLLAAGIVYRCIVALLYRCYRRRQPYRCRRHRRIALSLLPVAHSLIRDNIISGLIVCIAAAGYRSWLCQKTCEITVKGNTTRRLVSATSLMTSDKEGLTDYDIEHLMNDTNGALWRVPGTNNFVACTIHDATETETTRKVKLRGSLLEELEQDSADSSDDDSVPMTRPPIAASQVTPNRKMTPVPPIAASQVTPNTKMTPVKPGPDAPKWGFSQQAQPWSKQTVDDYENMETQMPSEEHATHEIEESASMIVSKNSVDSDDVMSVVELVKDTHRIVQKMEGKDEEEKEKFMVGDVDILAIPAKNPIKFCLQAMDILFTRDEMAHGRYKAVRQRGENKPLPPLDPKRVKLIDDAIIKRFGIEYYNKTAPQVKRQANQKCSDILTKRLNKK
ncbi:hypothetical protein EMCRGX_G015078 [Ephydatia muelleri]